jgi:hypothetical protein
LPEPPEAPLGLLPIFWLQPRVNATGPSGLSFPTLTADDVHVVVTHGTPTLHGDVVWAVDPVHVIVGDWPATVSARPTFGEPPLHTAGDAKRTVAFSCTEQEDDDEMKFEKVPFVWGHPPLPFGASVASWTCGGAGGLPAPGVPLFDQTRV